MIEYRARPAKPVNGRPSWHGLYRLDARGAWLVAKSRYGAIEYTTPASALEGARWCACRAVRLADESGTCKQTA
jgi:hypothetical protein